MESSVIDAFLQESVGHQKVQHCCLKGSFLNVLKLTSQTSNFIHELRLTCFSSESYLKAGDFADIDADSICFQLY